MEFQHGCASICANLGDDEWHPSRHETGDEGNVAQGPLVLRDDDRTIPSPEL